MIHFCKSIFSQHYLARQRGSRLRWCAAHATQRIQGQPGLKWENLPQTKTKTGRQKKELFK